MIAAVLAGAVIAGVFIPWAVRNDRADWHLAHTAATNCPDCEES